MLDWMKCNVGSGERKGEEVFPMLKIKSEIDTLTKYQETLKLEK